MPLELVAPKTNLQAYPILYSIENALRELIIERLEQLEGPRWYKHRLPGDILQLYRQARRIESRVQWSALVPHHPIYYVDFPSLKKVIERKDNWKDVFEPIFQRKDIFSGYMSSVEPIRNKVAHNRCVEASEVQTLHVASGYIANSVGEVTFAALASRSTSVPNLISYFTDLKAEGTQAINQCRNCRTIDDLNIWDSVSSFWWFDESFIGYDLSPVSEYFGTLNEYCHLPRLRGSGHTIEAWVGSKDLDTLFARSDDLLQDIAKTTS